MDQEAESATSWEETAIEMAEEARRQIERSTGSGTEEICDLVGLEWVEGLFIFWVSAQKGRLADWFSDSLWTGFHPNFWVAILYW